MPFQKNFYIIFSKGQILRIFRLKICPNFRCAGVRIPDNPRNHPLASICFQDEFFDKKSPESLWNLGLSDLHLLRSEKVYKGYEKDIFRGFPLGFELPRGLTNVGNTNLYNIFFIIHSDIFFCFSCFGDFSANKKCTFSVGWVSNLIVRESSTSANPRAV